jgi:hypothetical protein
LKISAKEIDTFNTEMKEMSPICRYLGGVIAHEHDVAEHMVLRNAEPVKFGSRTPLLPMILELLRGE